MYFDDGVTRRRADAGFPGLKRDGKITIPVLDMLLHTLGSALSSWRTNQECLEMQHLIVRTPSSGGKQSGVFHCVTGCPCLFIRKNNGEPCRIGIVDCTVLLLVA